MMESLPWSIRNGMIYCAADKPLALVFHHERSAEDFVEICNMLTMAPEMVHLLSAVAVIMIGEGTARDFNRQGVLNGIQELLAKVRSGVLS